MRHTLAGHASAPTSCPTGQFSQPSHSLALATQLPEASSLPSPQSSVPSQRKRRDTHRLLPQANSSFLHWNTRCTGAFSLPYDPLVFNKVNPLHCHSLLRNSSLPSSQSQSLSHTQRPRIHLPFLHLNWHFSQVGRVLPSAYKWINAYNGPLYAYVEIPLNII
uniref:Uncharacterized protein n=1 Tax=Oncorhynchus kisutch TaxID=8019 RepID=A0A8C7JTN5_ONCKI